MKYRIAFQSKATGYEGHGQWFDENQREMLEGYKNRAAAMYPDLDHWIESEEEVEKSTNEDTE